MNSNLPNDMREHDAIEPLRCYFQCYRDVGIYEGKQQIEGKQRQKVKDEGGPHGGGEIWMMDKTSEMHARIVGHSCCSVLKMTFFSF